MAPAPRARPRIPDRRRGGSASISQGRRAGGIGLCSSCHPSACDGAVPIHVTRARPDHDRCARDRADSLPQAQRDHPSLGPRRRGRAAAGCPAATNDPRVHRACVLHALCRSLSRHEIGHARRQRRARAGGHAPLGGRPFLLNRGYAVIPSIYDPHVSERLTARLSWRQGAQLSRGDRLRTSCARTR